MDLNDSLLVQAKVRAAKEGISLKALIEQALRVHLKSNAAAKHRYALKWQTERGRLQPGVRIDDRDALYDLMEERT